MYGLFLFPYTNTHTPGQPLLPFLSGQSARASRFTVTDGLSVR